MIVPFAIILSVSGAIYLFNPQYQLALEKSINSRAVAMAEEITPISADEIVMAAQLTHPGFKFRRMTLPRFDADRSFEVELTSPDGNRILWVDKFTADILHDVKKSDRLMEIVKDVHEGLLMGNKGSYLVELMASWMILLIISGVFLWWPRGRSILSVFIPRLSGQTKRQKLRQLHGMIGAWIGGFVILLLLSGLPWTQLWGGGFERLTRLLNWEGPAQEWVITLESQDPHAEHRGEKEKLKSQSSETGSETSLPAISVAEIVETAQSLQIGAPIEIQPPASAKGVWTIKSMMQDRTKRLTVHYDQWTGEEIMRIGFKDRHPVQQLTGYGIALHEGALFGWLNQLLGLLAALGVVALSVTGAWMWWSRRPASQLGAPPMPTDSRLKKLIIAVILALALFLPMVMISLIVILTLDFLWSKLRLIF